MKPFMDSKAVQQQLSGKEITPDTIIAAMRSLTSDVLILAYSEGQAEQEVSEYFADYHDAYIHSNYIGGFNIDEKDAAESLRYNVRVHESYIDSGSIDYCYTVRINEV